MSTEKSLECDSFPLLGKQQMEMRKGNHGSTLKPVREEGSIAVTRCPVITIRGIQVTPTVIFPRGGKGILVHFDIE